MNKLRITLLIILVFLSYKNVQAQSKVFDVDSFDKVIISPHIQVTFVEGKKESVIINSINVPDDKLHIDVSGKTLQIYLEGAKTVTKSEKVEKEDGKKKESIYKGTIVKATVIYRSIDDLSLRGDEKFECKSAFNQEKLVIKIYGESKVYLNEVKLNSFITTIYGESYLEVKKGSILKHKMVAYGESEINTFGVISNSVKITAYGGGDIRINASEEIRVTAYGEANITYKGAAQLNKGIVIGEANIKKIN